MDYTEFLLVFRMTMKPMCYPVMGLPHRNSVASQPKSSTESSSPSAYCQCSSCTPYFHRAWERGPQSPGDAVWRGERILRQPLAAVAAS